MPAEPAFVLSDKEKNSRNKKKESKKNKRATSRSTPSFLLLGCSAARQATANGEHDLLLRTFHHRVACPCALGPAWSDRFCHATTAESTVGLCRRKVSNAGSGTVKPLHFSPFDAF
jgi:hypothetical protein